MSVSVAVGDEALTATTLVAPKTGMELSMMMVLVAVMVLLPAESTAATDHE